MYVILFLAGLFLFAGGMLRWADDYPRNRWTPVAALGLIVLCVGCALAPGWS
jgi:hypothetical protein